jgi:ABC-type transport system substrate-binding protein
MAWFGIQRGVRRGGGKKKEAAKKVLRVGTLTPVGELDPRRTQELGTVMVLTQVFEPPFELPVQDQPPQPILFAEPLRAAEEGVLSAAVRPGVAFSDGTPLTAELVAGSLAATDVVARAATIEARGDRVWFRLRRPNPRFDVVLSQSYAGIVLQREGELRGTGPFIVASSQADLVRLVRNPCFRQPSPLDEVEFRTYGSQEALAAAVDSGEVDLTSALSRDDVARVREARKQFLPGASTAILYFNTERRGLDDARVRRALALAIDRVEVTRASYSNALAFAATSLLPPIMGTFRDGLSHSPERGRELLREAGERLPERLRLLLVWGPRPYLPQPETAAAVVGRQLAEVGVTVEVVPTATNEEYNRLIAAGDYDLLLSGWIADTLDPADYLDANLSSEHVPAPKTAPVNRANRSRWRDDVMDDLLARFREQRSEEARAAALERVREEVPLLPLMYGPTVVVHGWRVTGFEPSPLGLPSLAAVDVEPS